MAKRLLDYDPLTRTKTWHEYDHQSGKTHIQTEQDVSGYLKRNKALQSSGYDQAQSKRTGWKRIASIPNTVIMQIKKEHNIDVFNQDDLPKLEKLLQSNEFKYLRTVDRI